MQGTSSTGKSLGLNQQHGLLSSLIHESDHQFRSTLLPSLLWTKTRRVALYPHRGCHIISLPYHIKCTTDMTKSSFWHLGIYFSPYVSHRFFELQEAAVDGRPSNLSTSFNLVSNQQSQWSALLASMRCWTVPRCCGSWCHDGTPSKKQLRTGAAKHDLTNSKEPFGFKGWNKRERLCDLRTETPVTLVHEKTWSFNISLQGDFWVTIFISVRRPPNNFLDLRELSSPLLWLLACRRSHKSLSKALAGNHRKEAKCRGSLKREDKFSF